jgi:hypothetical protein
VDLMVGRRHLFDLSALKAPQGKLHTFPARPRPHQARGAKLGETLEDGPDRTMHSLVGIEQHVSDLFAPYQPDRQPALRLAALGFVTDPAIQALAESCATPPRLPCLCGQQQPVIERAGVILPSEIADHSVSHSARIKQVVLVTVITSHPRALESKHETGTAGVRWSRHCARVAPARTDADA